MIEPVPYSNAWHILAMALVFFCGIAISVGIGKRIGSNASRSFGLYAYHTIWCLFYFWYAGMHGSDSFAYFHAGVLDEGEFWFGSRFVILLVELLNSLFGLSYLGVFLVFNIFGTVGYLLFDASLRFASIGSKKWVHFLALFIILLPSVSFWSSAISKDAISFMAVGCALWASIDLGRRQKLMLFAVFAMLMVRPHMAGLMLMALSVAMFFDPSASVIKRLCLTVLFVTAAFFIVPFALDYAGVKGGASIDSVSDFIDKRQSYSKGDSAVDIANMSLIEKLFTYAFRPVIFEARTVFGLAASLDNMILLFLVLYGSFLAFKYRLDEAYGNNFFMLLYSLSAWLILSLTTANLGIALRQKWMFVPFIIYLAFSYINKRQTR